MRKAILCGACVYVCMWKCVIRLIHVIFVPYSVVHVCARECGRLIYVQLLCAVNVGVYV
jgi:ferredoxin